MYSAKRKESVRDLPDPDQIALKIMEHIPDLTFAINADEAMYPAIRKGVIAAMSLAVRACVHNAREYEPIGYRHWDEVKEDIVQILEELRK